jgi:DNA-directed RNA polymerase specialized sigma24 family protein
MGKSHVSEQEIFFTTLLFLVHVYEKERGCITLKFIENLTSEEIASDLNLKT